MKLTQFVGKIYSFCEVGAIFTINNMILNELYHHGSSRYTGFASLRWGGGRRWCSWVMLFQGRVKTTLFVWWEGSSQKNPLESILWRNVWRRFGAHFERNIDHGRWQWCFHILVLSSQGYVAGYEGRGPWTFDKHLLILSIIKEGEILVWV